MSPWAPAARAPAAPGHLQHLGARGQARPWVPGGHGCPGTMGARGPVSISLFYSGFLFFSKGRIVTIPGFHWFFILAPGETWGNRGNLGKTRETRLQVFNSSAFSLDCDKVPFPAREAKVSNFSISTYFLGFPKYTPCHKRRICHIPSFSPPKHPNPQPQKGALSHPFGKGLTPLPQVVLSCCPRSAMLRTL